MRAARYALVLLLGAVLPADGEEAARFENRSTTTRCAEEDNVYVTLSGAGIRRFEIAARQPAYIAAVRRDRTGPDIANCRFAFAKDHSFEPRRAILHEDERVLLRGITHRRNWRPERVEIAVGDRLDGGVHLVQLFLKRAGQLEEILVLHAADGYWRARPLPAPRLQEAVYGSSFLIGPVEEEGGRPLVKLRRVAFDPRAWSFALDFAAGGAGRLTVLAAGDDEVRLEAELDPAALPGAPFAALRSMFVTPRNADVASVVWRPAGDPLWRESPILAFEGATAPAARFGRTTPSRHNTSAPDMIFERFRSD